MPHLHNCWSCTLHEIYVKDPSFIVDICKKLDKLTYANWSTFLLLVGPIVFLSLINTADGTNGTISNNHAFISTLKISLSILGIIASVLVFNTSRVRDDQVVGKVEPHSPWEPSDEERMFLANALRDMIRIPTISYDVGSFSNKTTDHTTFLRLHRLLEELFPRLHASKNITKTVISQYSLVYEWKGKDSSLPPVMICAHLDVVPTPDPEKWVHPPFEGFIDDDQVIWGRGAIDDKHNLLTQMYAIETLLGRGVEQLRRTVYFAIGHDEEIGGLQGAKEISKYMKKKLADSHNSAKLEFILDEGTFGLDKFIPGVKTPIALVANCEKGSVSVQLSVSHYPPRHSSFPDTESNVGVLAAAISRLERAPVPAHVDGFVNSILQLGNALPYALRMVLSNEWLFNPILRRIATKTPPTAAACRTTTAVTIVSGGSKINAIPGVATAWVNHRVHPSDSIERILEYDRMIINDPRVKLEIYEPEVTTAASPVSSLSCFAFQSIKRNIAKIYNIPTMPMTMIGNTDTRHYWDIAQDLYRFSPMVMDHIDDLTMFHGYNERIHLDKLVKMCDFYMLLYQDL